MTQSQTTMVDPIVQDINEAIKRRLRISNGKCLISTRNLAKGVLQPTGQWDNYRLRKRVMELIDELLLKAGGVAWDKGKWSLTIYKFDAKEGDYFV